MPGDFFSSLLDKIEAVREGIDFDLWSTSVEPRHVDFACDGSVASSRLEVNEVCKSLIKGRRTGTHWTIIVPVTSAEYHTWETFQELVYSADLQSEEDSLASRHISVQIHVSDSFLFIVMLPFESCPALHGQGPEGQNVVIGTPMKKNLHQ